MSRLFNFTQLQQDLILESLNFISRVFWKTELELAQTVWDKGLTDLFEALREHFSTDFQKVEKSIDFQISKFVEFDTFFEHLETTYVRLFVNGPGGVTAPLYHSCYEDHSGKLMGKTAQSMRSLISNAGMELSSDSGEIPDHLCLELEYLVHLLDKGWETGNEKMLADSSDFIKTMLMPWVEQLRDKLANDSDPGIYLPMAELLMAVLNQLIGK